MNGRRYLLDTNAIIQLLAHNPHLEAIVADAGFIATIAKPDAATRLERQ